MPISNEKEFNRYLISRDDFEDALKFLKETLHFKENSVAYEALLLSAVVYYSRPFSPNEIKSDAPATSKIDFADMGPVSEAETVLHKKLIRIRNKAIAHSESSHYPVSLSPTTPVATSQRFALSAEQIDIALFQQLAEKFQVLCNLRCGTFALNSKRRGA
jgi:hypothetical protein